jgi:hypothetical protein
MKCIDLCKGDDEPRGEYKGRHDWRTDSSSSYGGKDSWGARAARDNEPNPFEQGPKQEDKKIDFDKVSLFDGKVDRSISMMKFLLKLAEKSALAQLSTLWMLT